MGFGPSVGPGVLHPASLFFFSYRATALVKYVPPKGVRLSPVLGAIRLISTHMLGSGPLGYKGGAGHRPSHAGGWGGGLTPTLRAFATRNASKVLLGWGGKPSPLW